VYHLSSYPRYLNFFPTRRSSDLHGVGVRHPVGVVLHVLVDAVVEPLDGSHATTTTGPGWIGRADLAELDDAVADGLLDGGEHVRSEEHTSELQSRENLVCRLLLE